MDHLHLLHPGLCGGLAAALLTSVVTAQTADLRQWQDGDQIVCGSSTPFEWVVSPDGSSVRQSFNGNPTWFVSDLVSQAGELQFVINPASSDDDRIGFSVGFHPGSSTAPSADYILVDWKKATQVGQGLPCGPTTQVVGLSATHVFGIPDCSEIAAHADYACNGTGNGARQFDSGIRFGSTGWANNTDYHFTLRYRRDSLKLFIDGQLELDLTPDAQEFPTGFPLGSFAFYNQSQAGAVYSNAVPTVSEFCFGDGLSTLCPCGNSGVRGSGCANSSFSAGARLRASGDTEISSDNLALIVDRASINTFGIFIQGDLEQNMGIGVPGGNGLLCIGGNLLRLGVAPTNSMGQASFAQSIPTAGAVSGASTRYYQFWYRDSGVAGCQVSYNFTNALAVTWTP